MIYEIAEIDIKPGQEEPFIEAVKQATEQFKNATGCNSLKLEKGIENPSRFRLVVGWETVNNHMVDFRNSDGFQIWRQLVSGFFASPPKVGHVEVAFVGF